MDIKTHIRKELFKNLENFTNEVDLLFDYIPKDTVKKVNLYIKNIKNSTDDLDNFLDLSYDSLKDYEVDMSFVLFSKQKVKTQRLDFMNQIKLFPLKNSDESKQPQFLLDLNNFSSENKNTKKSLLKYIYNIYMTCSFLRNDSKDPSEALNEFVSKIRKEVEEACAKEDALNAPKIEEDTSANENSLSGRRGHGQGHGHGQRKNNIQGDMASNLQNLLSSTLKTGLASGLPSGLLNGLQSMPKGMPKGMPNGMDKMMSSLLQNNEIMGIATDIAEQMKTQKINPMSLLTEMMSGNIDNLSEDSKIGKLVNNIQQKVEAKINNGAIDKTLFEQEAKNILESVNKEELNDNNLPGLSDIMNNMMKNVAGVKISNETNEEIPNLVQNEVVEDDSQKTNNETYNVVPDETRQ